MMEKKIKKRAPRATGIVGQTALATIKVAGMITLAALAPNVIGALGKLGFIGTRQQRYYVNKSLERLKARGYIVFRRNSQGFMCATLTERGEREIQKQQSLDLHFKKLKKWDGKYHVVIFDIKEWKKRIRDDIRFHLKKIGFLKLQNSVWVYPYYCEDLINLIKAKTKIGKEVLYMVVDSVESDTWIRNYFDLPLPRS